MSGARVAMVGLWRKPEGYRGRVWRRAEGDVFSPSDMPVFEAPDLATAARAVADALSLSRHFSELKWSATEADAEFVRMQGHGPASMGDEVYVDLDVNGHLSAWRQYLDAHSRFVCQALLPCGPEPADLARALGELLDGAQPPAGAADVQLGIATLLRWQAQDPDWDDAAVASALTACATRLEPAPVAEKLRAAAAAVEAGTTPRASRLWNEPWRRWRGCRY